jgi:hypothetical protein
MKAWKDLWREEGSFPILAIIMIGLLVFTGLAFMKWGADESWEARYEKHKLQAYYAAHAGIMDLGYDYLRHMQPSAVPTGGIEYAIGTETITNANNQPIATAEVTAKGISLNSGGTGLNDFNYVYVRSVGKVDFLDYESNTVTVTDETKMTVKLLNLSNFLYLTNIETTVFGEAIKFWYLDTLNGWVHSNDTIAMQGLNGQPIFLDHVSTTAPIFTYFNGANPYFAYPPMFNYREIQLPTTAEDVRNAAASSGTFFVDFNGYYAHRLVFSTTGWIMYRWPMGYPFSDTVVAVGGVPNWQAIFVDGYLELQGLVRGTVTVGAHGSHQTADTGYQCIRLMDDLRYASSSPYNGTFSPTITDMIGVISEGDIVIGNTPENGRDNCGMTGSWQSQTNMNRKSIIITGALVALGESFTFEDQNDTYFWEYSTGYQGPSPDHRGDIILHGAVTQYRRGYVHRSTHGDTGYGKHYYYDPRLNQTAPPYFIAATDASGAAAYEIVSWGNR